MNQTTKTTQRFDPRGATGKLLLLSGSLVAGLTAFWLTPKASGQATTSTASSENVWASQDEEFTPQNAPTEEAWDDDNGWQTAQNQQPSFSPRAQQAPQGWTRGS